MKKDLTYGEYLGLDQILNAQKTLSQPPQQDEMLFIIIHQVYELLFKQIMHEIKFLQQAMVDNDLRLASKKLYRILKILKTLVAQMDIMETMTPVDFLSFREFLAGSSGFQSLQFRCFEAKCGIHHHEYFTKNYGYSADELALLKQHMDDESIWESFILAAQALGADVPAPVRNHRNGVIFDPSPAVKDFLVDAYKSDHAVSGLCDLMIDMDEGLQEWRYRHVKMVERTIGDKMGTGGSSGVGYLRSTLHIRIFPDLWEIRNLI